MHFCRVKKYLKILGFIVPLLILFSIWLFKHLSENNPVARGKILYEKHCTSCHGADGKGIRKLIPPLAGADYIVSNTSRLPCIIRYGIEDTITVNGVIYRQPMLGVTSLEDDQIADLISYILESWNPGTSSPSIKDVRNSLDQCK